MTVRASTYSDEVADRILERITDGESLRAICKDDDMPGLRTVYRWLAANLEFCAAYEKAIEVRCEHLFSEMLEIADNPEPGSDIVARDRLRVDTRKWALSKMLPKKYSERMAVESTTELTVRQPQLDLSHLSQAERDTMRALLMKGGSPEESSGPGSRH